MLDTIRLKYIQGSQYIKDIKNAPMRSQFRGFPVIDSNAALPDASCCPSGALYSNSEISAGETKQKLSIDLGKCTLCGNCSCGAVKFSNRYKLGADSREKLIITEDITADEYEKQAIKARKEISKIFSKSLKLRQVSAGGCGGCEMELNACSNANFDMGRFGIEFTASPRHADGIVITGPVTKNMAFALEDCFNSVPEPKIIILAGACSISGGVFYKSKELDRSFLDEHPADLYIPGCPVHPLTFINALLSYIS